MFEPRGHDVMSGAILYPPCREDCDTGVLYIEVSGCLPMCGHGTIGTVTFALEQGLVRPREEGRLRLDTPAGLVVADYERTGRFVERVRLTNVASYLALPEVRVDCPGLGARGRRRVRRQFLRRRRSAAAVRRPRGPVRRRHPAVQPDPASG